MKEELKNLRLTFYPSSVIQKAIPAKEIPEVDIGTLTPESIERIKYLIKNLNNKTK